MEFSGVNKDYQMYILVFPFFSLPHLLLKWIVTTILTFLEFKLGVTMSLQTLLFELNCKFNMSPWLQQARMNQNLIYLIISWLCRFILLIRRGPVLLCNWKLLGKSSLLFTRPEKALIPRFLFKFFCPGDAIIKNAFSFFFVIFSLVLISFLSFDWL